MRPLPSIHAEKPVLAAISSGLRHSTARNTPQARCMSNSLEPQNQPSLVRLTRMSGSRPSAANVVHLAADHVRQYGLVADVRRDATHAAAPTQLERRGTLARRYANRQRRELLKPGELSGKRHVLAEHHQVHLVVAAQQPAVAGNVGRRVETLHAVGTEVVSVDAQQQRHVERRGPFRPSATAACSASGSHWRNSASVPSNSGGRRASGS